jgi:hypothetical protein
LPLQSLCSYLQLLTMPTPSLILVPARFKTGKLYTPLATTSGGVVLGASGDFNVTRATTATRVNANGLIESVASGIPRLDYPIGGGCPALLVEPSGTNSIRNNSMVGAVAGTPGTLPTNHSTTLNGLTRTIVGTGTENGVDYIDLQFSGTATGAALTYGFETNSQIVAASGQAWTNSMWIKQIADAGGNRPAARVTIYEFNSGGTYLAEGSAIATLTSSLTRVSFTRTLANASTARVQPLIQFVLVSGTTYNFTIRIGYPQMELGSVATSVIPTTTAAVTRNADVISLSGAVSGCIGQTQGTIYAEFEIRSDTTTRRLFALSDGTQSNRVFLYYTSNALRAQIQATDISLGNPAAGYHKVAFAYQQSGVSGTLFASLDGGAVVSGTTAGTFPSVLNAVFIGKREDSDTTQQWNARIRSAAIYTSRLSNAELIALSTL